MFVVTVIWRPNAAGRQEKGSAADRLDVGDGKPGRSDVAGIRSEPGDGLLADRDQALAVALADDPDECAVHRQVLGIEAERLRDA